MAKSPTFDTITAAFASASLLNANFAAITTAFDNTISRDGSTPNQMLTDFDMNGNDLLNVGTLFAVDVVVAGISLAAQVAAAAASATAAAISETNAAASAAIVATLTEFTTLTDTPSTYVGQGSKFVKVNSGGTALEFIAGSASEPSDGDKGDITVTASGLTWNLDAGVVGATELATDAVETAKIKDVNVTTAKVALNAVTLALLEHGTTGDILFYGASGEPFRLAKGSDTEVLTLASGLPSWAAPSSADNFSTKLLHLQDQQASGSAGGTFTSGDWRTRVLNTEVTDEIGSTLSANQFTLPSGTYWFDASAPSKRSQENKLRLRNITDGSDTLIGQNANANTDDTSSGHSYASIRGRFTIAATKTFELQHRGTLTQTTDGFGLAASFGVIEIYADVRVWKVG